MVDDGLWPHQREAIHWLVDRRTAMLHIPMGGGKTRIAIETLRRRDVKRVLVVCPKSVLEVWPKEINRWWPWPRPEVTVLTGPIYQRAKVLQRLLQAGRPFVAITNYDAYWRKPLAEVIARTQWDAVVMDEIHRLKMPGGKASLFAAYIRDRARLRLGLTGTPMPHSPLDIYAQFRFLDPDIYGRSYATFRAKYAVMGGFEGRQVVGFRNLDDLARRMAAITYRVDDSAIHRPEALDVVRYCQLEASAWQVYQSLEDDLVAMVGKGVLTVANALVKLLRLQQLTGGTLRNDAGQEVEVSKAKEELLADVLEDLPPTEPVVVFCRFLADLDRVHKVAQSLKRPSLELSGRRNELGEWQRGKGVVLATQIRTGSLGIDMTRAAYAVFYSLGYSLGEYQQARARLVRPGQKRSVTFVHLLAKGTVDEEVMEALEHKAEVVEYVLRKLMAVRR